MARSVGARGVCLAKVGLEVRTFFASARKLSIFQCAHDTQFGFVCDEMQL